VRKRASSLSQLKLMPSDLVASFLTTEGLLGLGMLIAAAQTFYFQSHHEGDWFGLRQTSFILFMVMTTLFLASVTT